MEWAVNAFATGLDHPRTVFVLPNGDVLVAESNAPPKPNDSSGIKGWIHENGDEPRRVGVPARTASRCCGTPMATAWPRPGAFFLEGLNSPFGMALFGEDFYVANSDAIMKFPYHEGDTRITAPGVKLADLPAAPSIITGPRISPPVRMDQSFTLPSAPTAMSARTASEAETNRAAVLEVDRATGKWRVFRVRPSQSERTRMGAAERTLWVTVNERDELGNDLVPDYMTSVKDGGFYGWPYSYYGQHVDDRVSPQRPDLVATAIARTYAARRPHRFARADVQHRRFCFHLKWPAAPLSASTARGIASRAPATKVIFVPFADGKTRRETPGRADRFPQR